MKIKDVNFMKRVITDPALDDLKAMDNSTYDRFKKHLIKLDNAPLKRHMRRGFPYFVDEVGQGRLVYKIIDDTIIISRCFATHKEYERWYRSYA